MFWKKKETISRAIHDSVLHQLQATMQERDDAKANYARIVRAKRAMFQDLIAARAEAEANKVDAEAHRERLRRDREYHQRRRQRVAA